MTPTINWPRILSRADKRLWKDSYRQLEIDTYGSVPWYARMAGSIAWHFGIPSWLMREAVQMADCLGVSIETVLMAQVTYDEGWAAEANVPGHGCTSVSIGNKFGRNLDYAYPDNASELVFQRELPVGDTTIFVEGFAGLLGWLAFRIDDHAASFNQAPCLRKLKRTRMPALAWFRQHSMLLPLIGEKLESEGDEWMQEPAAADFLLHIHSGRRRFLVETYDQQIAWSERADEVLVQTNTYQVLDLKADRDWERDSRDRIKAAKAKKTLPSALKAAANEYTVDTVLLK